MDATQDPQMKRKLQNRNAQRRFRNRKKATDITFLDLPYVGENTECSSITPPQLSSTSQNMPVEPLDDAIIEAHSSSDGTSLYPTPESRSFGGSSLGTQELNIPQAWSRPSSVLSDPNLDMFLEAEGEDFFGSYGHFSHGIAIDTNPTTLGNGVSRVFNPTLGATSVSRIDSTERLSPGNVDPPSEMNFFLEEDNQRGSSIDKGANRPPCCVAHKAEMMVSDLQKLWRFGLQFGFFEAEDKEIQYCLGFLRGRLRQMSECPNMNRCCSNPSDSNGR
ncbi:hypothetical protein FSARC_8303 [Fusarium sarcochroum]|uniref:BZIP domain-containing protein n=1 Tax=Fusarium sarcochroum TaxID=1208366 RepID=A0A8H4X7C8_9HYPO|nr:hypothetical protein FSARC_8303 [Fusarium sarcochroum]